MDSFGSFGGDNSGLPLPFDAFDTFDTFDEVNFANPANNPYYDSFDGMPLDGMCTLPDALSGWYSFEPTF
jgi:hypothetical protein